MRESDPSTATIRSLQIVGAALMGGVAALTVVVWYLLTYGGFIAVDLPDVVQYTVLATFVVSIPVAPALRARVDPPEAGGSPVDIVGRYRVGTIVAFAVREGMGLLGIIVSLLIGSPGWALGYGVATVLSMALGWPKATELAERLRRAG